MNKLLFAVLILTYPAASFGCAFPSSGAEFDRLISFRQVGKNKYRAKISKTAVELSFGAEIRVAYYPEGSEHRYGVYWKELHITQGNLNYLTSFDLVKIEGHVPYISVFWYPEKPGLCGAIGRSEDLLIE